MRNITSCIFLLTLLLSACNSTKKIVEQKPLKSELNAATQRQFQYYFYEGLKQKENQQYDQALETFRMCVDIDSMDAGAQSEMGILYASIGLTEDAVKYLEKAVELDPKNWWYSIRLVSVYTNLKKWQEAIELANILQKYYPNKEEVYNMLGSLYKETKDYEKAIVAYEKLERLIGIDEATSFEKIQLFLITNKQAKVIVEIDKLIKKYPTESRYKVLRGDIFMQQKMPEMAFEAYQKVLADDPQNAFVYVSLSDYYKYINKPEMALNAIMNALKSEQLDVETKVEVLGQYVEKLMQDSTKLDQTESLFKLLVDKYPMEEQVHGYYALFLQFRNRNAEAISELETMLNINAKNEQTWLRIIQINTFEKNYKRILDLTTQAAENLPDVPNWYFYKGIAQYQLNDFNGALITFKTALPLLTKEQKALKSDFYAQIADIFFKIEMKDSAFANYEKALAINPQNSMVMNNYAYYLSLEKKELKKAEKMSAKTVELEPKNSTYLDTYAWILYEQGNYSLAKFYIEKAIDNLPKGDDAGVILEHYGDILWMHGKGDELSTKKAVEMWQKSYDAGNKTDELKQKIENKAITK